jgi:hypothetical protein
LRSGPQFDEVPQIDGAYCKAHAAIETYGVLGYRDPTFQSLYKLRKKRDLTSDRLNLSLHAAHYLTADDIVPLLVLLLIETGLELECCKSLTLDCLRNAAVCNDKFGSRVTTNEMAGFHGSKRKR